MLSSSSSSPSVAFPSFSWSPWASLVSLFLFSSFILFFSFSFWIFLWFFPEILVAEKRVFPMNIQLWLVTSFSPPLPPTPFSPFILSDLFSTSFFSSLQCLCVSVMMISYFLGGRNPQTQVWCSDPGTYNTQHTNNRCAAQGYFSTHLSLLPSSFPSSLCFFVSFCPSCSLLSLMFV